jgi:hypothetical protein
MARRLNIELAGRSFFSVREAQPEFSMSAIACYQPIGEP